MHVKYFGQYLLEKKYITREQLIEGIKHQKMVNRKIGVLAIDKQYMTAAQVREVLEAQKIENNPFGELAVSKSFLTKEQLYDLLTIQKSDRIFLGEALLDKKFITLEQLEIYINDYKAEQQKASKVLSDFYNLDPKYAGLIQDSTQIILNMLVRLVDETGKIAGCHNKFPESGEPIEDYRFIYQKIFGHKNFILGVSLTEATIVFFANKMFQQTINDYNEIAQDGIKEFLNISIGHICSALSNEGIQTETTPPLIVPLKGFSPDLTNTSEFIVPIHMANNNFNIHYMIN